VTLFLRVLVFYLVTMVFSGVLNALQSATGPDPDLIQWFSSGLLWAWA